MAGGYARNLVAVVWQPPVRMAPPLDTHVIPVGAARAGRTGRTGRPNDDPVTPFQLNRDAKIISLVAFCNRQSSRSLHRVTVAVPRLAIRHFGFRPVIESVRPIYTH